MMKNTVFGLLFLLGPFALHLIVPPILRFVYGTVKEEATPTNKDASPTHVVERAGTLVDEAEAQKTARMTKQAPFVTEVEPSPSEQSFDEPAREMHDATSQMEVSQALMEEMMAEHEAIMGANGPYHYVLEDLKA